MDEIGEQQQEYKDRRKKRVEEKGEEEAKEKEVEHKEEQELAEAVVPITNT